LAEPVIVVANQEELNCLLSETSGLEYIVMLAYLFAAFSIKTDVSEVLPKRSSKRSHGGMLRLL